MSNHCRILALGPNLANDAQSALGLNWALDARLMRCVRGIFVPDLEESSDPRSSSLDKVRDLKDLQKRSKQLKHGNDDAGMRGLLDAFPQPANDPDFQVRILPRYK